MINFCFPIQIYGFYFFQEFSIYNCCFIQQITVQMAIKQLKIRVFKCWITKIQMFYCVYHKQKKKVFNLDAFFFNLYNIKMLQLGGISAASPEKLKVYEDYSSSYATVGHITMNLPIVHQLPQTIAAMLPHNYMALDLGSGNGKDSQNIENQCKILSKQGTFIKVDPFMNQEGIIKQSMQQFIEKQAQNSYDLIFCKCAFHFNKDQPKFFKNVHRCLKKSGKFILIQIGNQCHLPWTNTLQQRFLSLLLLAQDFIPKNLFKSQKFTEFRQCSFNRQTFRQFVKNRAWSNLLTHTDEQIDQCLRFIGSQQKSINGILSIWVYVNSKIMEE